MENITEYENKMLLMQLWRLSGLIECLKRDVKIKKKHEDMIKANILKETNNGMIRKNLWKISSEFIKKKRELQYILPHCIKY